MGLLEVIGGFQGSYLEAPYHLKREQRWSPDQGTQTDASLPSLFSSSPLPSFFFPLPLPPSLSLLSLSSLYLSVPTSLAHARSTHYIQNSTLFLQTELGAHHTGCTSRGRGAGCSAPRINWLACKCPERRNEGAGPRWAQRKEPNITQSLLALSMC